jgi:hypothetical protein
MKPALITALLFAAVATAAAQTPAAPPEEARAEPPPFDPPPWPVDATHAAVMMRDLMAPFPENVHATSQVWSLRPPSGGGQLIASALLIGVTGEGQAFIRSRLDEVRRTPEIVAGSDPTAKVRTVSWQEKVDDKQRIVDARLEWAQDDHGTISLVRVVWIRPTVPENTIEEFRVECVIATDQVAALRPACEKAIASLRPRTFEERLPIAVAAAPAPEPADDENELDAPGASMRETPTTIGPVLASTPAREEARDMRPFYVGGFLLIVIAVLWWNRKKRAELDAESERDAGDPDAPVDVPDADADADDLAAAGRDDKEPE